jgi:hypothetical protein
MCIIIINLTWYYVYDEKQKKTATIVKRTIVD